jgi:hypothetical protein
MNEPASVCCSQPRVPFVVLILLGQFCVYPCDDPSAQAIENGFPPNRTSPAPNPNATIFSNASIKLSKRDAPSHEGNDLMNPPYAIDNAQGVLSDRTAYVCLSLLTCDTTHEWMMNITRLIRFMQMVSLNMTHVSRSARFTPRDWQL